MNLAMCEVPVHPVEHLPSSALANLPVLPMTQSADGTYFCDGESTQDGTPSPDNPIPITNTYTAGTYKAICGDKTYKVVLDDDLRSVPGVADRIVIDAGRGKLKIEKGIGYIESYTDETVETVYMSSTGELTEGATVIYQLATPTTHHSIPTKLLTIQSGRSAQLLNTVNDKADFLKVGGDSWQLVQDEIVDEDGNVTQPAMPSPEYQSEIKDVGGKMQSCGWNYYSGGDLEGTQNQNTGTIQTIPPGTYIIRADVESSDTDNTKCFILFYNGTTMLNGVVIGRGKGAQTTATISENVTKFTCYASNSNLNSLGDTFSFRNIQITKGDTTHPYDRHRGNSITLPKLRGLPDGTRDTLYVDRRNKRAWVERNVGHIESYNGESVGDVFMSSTGELSTGAVVHYKHSTPVIEELPYSDYLLDTCQWETNFSFVDCDSHLVPEIEVGCKVLGR